MNLKRTLSAAVLAFALTMMPAFVACSPDDNKTDIETPDNPNKPENPDPEPNPNPEPGPNPEPSVTTGAKWLELPAVNAKEEGTKYLVDAENSDLYYAYHLCNGPEKYVHNGKRARNYTTCFSKSHHCPVWVAAIRHNSLHPIGKAKRTDDYKKIRIFLRLSSIIPKLLEEGAIKAICLAPTKGHLPEKQTVKYSTFRTLRHKMMTDSIPEVHLGTLSKLMLTELSHRTASIW